MTRAGESPPASRSCRSTCMAVVFRQARARSPTRQYGGEGGEVGVGKRTVCRGQRIVSAYAMQTRNARADARTQAQALHHASIWPARLSWSMACKIGYSDLRQPQKRHARQEQTLFPREGPRANKRSRPVPRHLHPRLPCEIACAHTHTHMCKGQYDHVFICPQPIDLPHLPIWITRVHS